MSETGFGGECQDGRGLVGPMAIALSPDGENAYVAAASFNSLSILTRNPAGGSLTPIPSASGCFDSVEALYPDCTKVRELGGAADVAVSPDGLNVYVASPDDSAVVVFDRDPIAGGLSLSGAADGCVNEDGSNGCVNGRALDRASAVLVSPDGENVYVASEGSEGGIAAFGRNAETGDLTQLAGLAGCVNYDGANGCREGLSQVLGTRNVEIDPNGEFVYAVSPGRDAVTIYSRDDATGELIPIAAPAGCIAGEGVGGCQGAVGLGEPVGLTIAADGKSAYIASERRDAILVYDRDTTSGALTQKAGTAGCISNTGLSDPMQAGTAGDCQNGLALDGVNSIAIPPDGTAAYATAGNSDGVVILERDSSGALTQRPEAAGCITETGSEDDTLPWTAGYCGDGHGLAEANGVIASGDSQHVYTTARQGGVDSFDVVEPPLPPTGEPLGPGTSESKAPNPGCEKARAARRRAERQLGAATRAIRSHSRKARQALKPAVKRLHTAAIRRLTRSANRFRDERRRAARLARRLCF